VTGRPSRRIAFGFLAAVVLAGCGSTVPAARRGTAAGSTSRSDTGLNGASPVDGGTPAAGGTTPSAPSAAANATKRTGSDTRIGGRQAGSSTTNGPGVTDSTITIGVTYYQSARAANAALGASNIDTGDPIAATRILVRDINSRGGIAGRKVELLLFSVDPQSSTPYATTAQVECTYFTQDHKVFALIDGTPAADPRACLEKSGVTYLGGSLLKNFLYPHEFDVYSAGTARVFAALVPALAEQGWFSPWDRLAGGPGTARAKVGIVTVDDPRESAIVDGVLLKGLRAAGYAPSPDDVIRVTPPGGFSDDGAVVAQIDNAVLKLNADGVDHVILDDNNGSLALLFNNYAYSQHYLPRYGGTSGNAWQLMLSAHNIQAATLAGAIGIGWQPIFDLPFEGGDGPASNPARHRCLALFSSNGMPAGDAGTAGGLAEGCDVAFFLPAAFQGYRGPVNANVTLQRVNALGASYQLASGLASRFAPDQHDGTGGFSAMRFDTGCSCMKYIGSTRPL
jgi:hypothetical protein